MQIGYSYDTIGYDTKSPYVVWNWPATGNTTDYYTKDITVAGEVIDDGGSGVAGYFADPHEPWTDFAPEAEVYWKSAATGGSWEPWRGWVGNGIVSLQKPLTVQINAFDHYRWHVGGTIYVYPNYNAEYCVCRDRFRLRRQRRLPVERLRDPGRPGCRQGRRPRR